VLAALAAPSWQSGSWGALVWKMYVESVNWIVTFVAMGALLAGDDGSHGGDELWRSCW